MRLISNESQYQASTEEAESFGTTDYSRLIPADSARTLSQREFYMPVELTVDVRSSAHAPRYRHIWCHVW